MIKAIKAYQKAQPVITDPTQEQIELFMLAAAKLQEYKDNWEDKRKDINKLMKAIIYIWDNVLEQLVMSDNSTLDIKMRSQLASLGISVSKYCLDISKHSKPEELELLIVTIRDFANGLQEGIALNKKQKENQR